jgi:hypothetical protein
MVNITILAIALSGLLICAYLLRSVLIDRREHVRLKQNGVNGIILQSQGRIALALTMVGIGMAIVAAMKLLGIAVDHTLFGESVRVGSCVAWWLIGLATLLARRAITQHLNRVKDQQHV